MYAIPSTSIIIGISGYYKLDKLDKDLYIIIPGKAGYTEVR